MDFLQKGDKCQVPALVKESGFRSACASVFPLKPFVHRFHRHPTATFEVSLCLLLCYALDFMFDWETAQQANKSDCYDSEIRKGAVILLRSLELVTHSPDANCVQHVDINWNCDDSEAV
jgi:hypothetical protein